MEVEELSPLAKRFPLTPTQGVPEEDDGFVDILENDLKVSSLAPSGPLHLPPCDVPRRRALSSCSKTLTPSRCQSHSLTSGQSEESRWLVLP